MIKGVYIYRQEPTGKCVRVGREYRTMEEFLAEALQFHSTLEFLSADTVSEREMELRRRKGGRRE